jgi:hypothetical protein
MPTPLTVLFNGYPSEARYVGLVTGVFKLLTLRGHFARSLVVANLDVLPQLTISARENSQPAYEPATNVL